MSSSDGFCKDHRDVNHLHFGAMLHLDLLGYSIGKGIGNHYCFKTCIVDGEMAGLEKIL